MKNKKSQSSGIGTLILFIAMILVAAIAAGLLIQVSLIIDEKRTSFEDKNQTIDINESVENISSTLIQQLKEFGYEETCIELKEDGCKSYALLRIEK